MNEFTGKVIINGTTVATTVVVSVVDDDNYLSVKVANSRKTLFIEPFTTQMIMRWGSAQMRSGIDYALAGTQVGFWNEGPTGHPGDGEFDFRPITSAKLRIEYYTDLIRMKIWGETEPGSCSFKGMPDPSNNRVLAAWAYSVEFSIPRVKLQKFLTANDRRYSSFERRLDECRTSHDIVA